MKYFSTIIISALMFMVAMPATAKEDKYLKALSTNVKFREAISYSKHIEKRSIELGLERLNKDDVEKLFGNKSGKYYAYEVALTNNSTFRIYINHIKFETIDRNDSFLPSDINDVLKDIDPGGRGNKDDMRKAALRTNLMNKSFLHTILAPGETTQGIVFIEKKSLPDDTVLSLQIQNLKRLAYLDLELPLED